jgi:hypothetical protein
MVPGDPHALREDTNRQTLLRAWAELLLAGAA